MYSDLRNLRPKLPLGLKTHCDSLCGFKTGLNWHIYSARTITSQCHSAPQITVISLELWRFINYVTYLHTDLPNLRLSPAALSNLTRPRCPSCCQNNSVKALKLMHILRDTEFYSTRLFSDFSAPAALSVSHDQFGTLWPVTPWQ